MVQHQHPQHYREHIEALVYALVPHQHSQQEHQGEGKAEGRHHSDAIAHRRPSHKLREGFVDEPVCNGGYQREYCTHHVPGVGGGFLPVPDGQAIDDGEGNQRIEHQGREVVEVRYRGRYGFNGEVSNVKA